MKYIKHEHTFQICPGQLHITYYRCQVNAETLDEEEIMPR